LRLDFALRHLPRPRRAAPVTIVPSFVLSAVNSHHNSGAAVAKNLSAPNVSTTAGSEVSRPENAAGNPVRAAVSALGQPAQLNRIRLPSLDRRSDPLVRRPLTSEVLRVKRAEGGSDG